jgi:hypothetical protein
MSNTHFRIQIKPILVLAIASLFLGSCGSGQVDQPPTSASKEDTTQNQKQPEVVQQVPINFREKAYVVKRAVVAKTFGNEYSTVTAQDGWTYIVVEYAIQNTTSESVETGYDDLVVTTDDGRIFEPDREADAKVGSVFGQQLHPGASKSRTVVYQLPIEALKKHPLFHIGEMQGGWSFAAVPLTEWHGEVHFQPGSEHFGNQAPEPSNNDSEIFVIKAKWSDSLRAFDCPAAAAAWENAKETHYANGKGLMKRCLIQSLSSQQVAVLERNGKYAKIEVLDGNDKGRSGWLPSIYLSQKKSETLSEETDSKYLENPESKPVESSETKTIDPEASAKSKDDSQTTEPEGSQENESKQPEKPMEKQIDQFNSE